MEIAESNSNRRNLLRLIGRYFTEIVIIFVGITISFIFDEWRQSRTNREKQILYINALIHDLNQEREDIEGDINGGRNFIKRVDTLLILKAKGEVSSSTVKYFQKFDGNLSAFVTTTPSYNKVSNSDQWQELPDSLKRKLFHLYEQEFSLLGKFHDKVNSLRYDFNRDFYLKNKIYLSSKLGILKSFFSSDEFINFHLMLRDNALMYNDARSRALKNTILLTDDLKQYLKQL